MLLLRLWNYIRGYVIIYVEGYFLEKFINICIHRQIYLWNIKRDKKGRMTLKMSIKGFKAIRPIAKKTGCRVHLKAKKGLPFFLNRYRRRKAFVVGSLIFVLALYVMTSFVWSVEINGNKNIDSSVIMNKLSSMGVRPGVLKYTINPDKVVDEMMVQIKELGWVGVTVKGTKVKVEVVERVVPPELVSRDRPCNIVAAKDGVIKDVLAKAGQDKVKAGDTVEKGQVLISGEMYKKGDEEKIGKEDVKPYYVHAMGEVKARTWYEVKVPVETKAIEKKRTGNSKSLYSVVLFGKQIPLWFNKNTYKNYDRVEIRKKICIGEDLVFPFELVIDKYYEINQIVKQLDEEQAKKIALDKCKSELADQIPAAAEEIQSDTAFIQDDNGNTIARMTVECVENIGVEKEIGGN